MVRAKVAFLATVSHTSVRWLPKDRTRAHGFPALDSIPFGPLQPPESMLNSGIHLREANQADSHAHPGLWFPAQNPFCCLGSVLPLGKLILRSLHFQVTSESPTDPLSEDPMVMTSSFLRPLCQVSTRKPVHVFFICERLRDRALPPAGSLR